MLLFVASFMLCTSFVASVGAACSNPNQQSCSNDYGVNEVYFGTGGALCDPTNPSLSEHSTNYCAKTSVGETGVGNTLGALYQAQAGFNTNREPSLAVLINDSQCTNVNPSTAGSSFNAGNLTTGSVAHVTGNFSVLSYLASGYVVQTVGTAPSYTSGTTHFLTTLSNATPAVGTEGFGMNLVGNTGTGYGASAFGYGVSQLPDATFGFGQASPPNGSLSLGYNAADKFSYRNGDQIAYSNKSSGVTCYFPSYVFSISPATPAGIYTFSQSIVVTSTY